ncbi:general transcription factor 3C polypeptide 2 [Halichoeres trimaculatus]|uniref:general transcription factor 3C polypeptide 2 n=1 Tax=Halichoeres trimaculatus TaxID=147232 RepID=UPI003D9F2AF9
MDPSDSGQGQEQPSEQPSDFLAPTSKGRQRKKNPKYFDFETEDTSEVQKNTPKVSPRGGRGVTVKKTPTRKSKAKNDTQEAADGEDEANVQTSPECDGVISKETPKKANSSRKTKATPVKKTPATDEGVQPIEGGVVEAEQQENGTPKPKRKYVRKQPVQKVEPVVEPPPCDGEEGGGVEAVQQENGTPKPKRKYVRKQPVQKVEPVVEPPPYEEEEEEIQPGGRRRRSAAKAALKYLHCLAQEVFSHPGDEVAPQGERNDDTSKTESHTGEAQKSLKGNKVESRGQRRKRCNSDPPDDEDFVPDAKEMEDEEDNVDDEDEEFEKEANDSESELWMNRNDKRSTATPVKRTTLSYKGTRGPNGLPVNMMLPVVKSAEATKKFREEHFSSWVFPEWIPSNSHWQPVPERDLPKYLPRELQSVAFSVSREGLNKEEQPLQRLSRFSALPAHPHRWDMFLFSGGPVWALEWCPTPDGAPASQYLALACHRGMDEKHCCNETYTGHGLVQLWDVCELDTSSRPESTPALSYGLAQDKGFIWQLKWCPAGGWEPPNTNRKAPLLPRLGLLAIASSTSVVTIYSLPHPEALLSNRKSADSGNVNKQLPIYKAEGVLTLKLGSFRAPHHEKSGQVLSMDWLPEKPHNIMAIGFYDGVVGLWDLSSRTGLLRVRESDTSLSLLPYRCFQAHDHAIRALAFCSASRFLLVTAGEDRYLKTWDLRRLQDPLTVQKRQVTNEVCWPLNTPGIIWAQDNAYAASGSHGVHYIDHTMRTFFGVPRTGTLWSLSFSDWLNAVVTADSLGEVIISLIPCAFISLPYLKRTKDRRFPVYLTTMVPHDATKEGNQVMGGEEEEEEGDSAEEQEGEETEGQNGSEGGNENSNENRGGGRRAGRTKNPLLRLRKYRQAAKRYFLHHADNNMLTFSGSDKRAIWKRMIDTEQKGKLNMDEMSLAALHKVRFSPNLLSHTWVASGGQAGLVRLICLQSLTCPVTEKIMKKSKSKFSTRPSAGDQNEAVQSVGEEL